MLNNDIDRVFFYTLTDYNEDETSRKFWKYYIDEKVKQINELENQSKLGE